MFKRIAEALALLGLRGRGAEAAASDWLAAINEARGDKVALRAAVDALWDIVEEEGDPVAEVALGILTAEE